MKKFFLCMIVISVGQVFAMQDEVLVIKDDIKRMLAESQEAMAAIEELLDDALGITPEENLQRDLNNIKLRWDIRKEVKEEVRQSK